MKGIPVLMYHALEDPSHPAGAIDSGEQLYILRADSFKEQMEYLHKNGYKTHFLQDALVVDRLPQRSVIITFDDGHSSNYTVALPLLEQYGFVAEFFITTGFIGRKNYLTEEQLPLLSLAGMHIGSHGVSHTFFNEMTSEQVVFEFEQSKKRIETITGIKINSFSAPGGRINRQVIEAGKKLGFTFFYSSEVRMLDVKNVQQLVPRVAMKNTTDMKAFVDIIEGNIAFYGRGIAKHKILQMLKITFGNHLYKKLHSIASKYS
jgi:peptidoglycan/xylan/chitin deacetylase (PgdA/CDA1 family)